MSRPERLSSKIDELPIDEENPDEMPGLLKVARRARIRQELESKE
jgi:hypothetical protein